MHPQTWLLILVRRYFELYRKQLRLSVYFWYNLYILQTFVNLPPLISESVSRILLRSDARLLSLQAKELHERYMQGANPLQPNIQKPTDCIAYLALRFPATFAQIASALSQIQERIPGWEPKSVLELGCGPGTGIWAAKSVWKSIRTATGVDKEQLFLTLAEEIQYDAKMQIDITWVKSTLIKWETAEDNTKYDLIIVANVLNELMEEERASLIEKITSRSSGVVLILEPGTTVGYSIVQPAARKLAETEHLIAPYIHNTFAESSEYWIHFSQRFQRPEFQRRIRQSMRESPLMASDWEDAKYSYVAWGNVASQKTIWGQCIGKIEKLKGFLTIPVLTADGVVNARVLKRNKSEYNFVKTIRWGELLEKPITTS